MMGVLAMIAGIGMSLAGWFQAARIWRTGRAEGVSLWTFGVLAFGCGIWLAYGISLGDWPLIVTYGIGLPGNGLAALAAGYERLITFYEGEIDGE